MFASALPQSKKTLTASHEKQVGNLGLNIKGGITVYYIRGYQASARVTAFKPGFRMLVGDPLNKKAATQQRQLCFRCEANMQQSPFGGAPCTGADTQEFPKQPCGGGWRVSLHFPSCWDGKNVDSPDHKSHVLVFVLFLFRCLFSLSFFLVFCTDMFR